jgi:hypothetical protein
MRLWLQKQQCSAAHGLFTPVSCKEISARCLSEKQNTSYRQGRCQEAALNISLEATGHLTHIVR